MAIFEIKGDRLEEIPTTNFASQGIEERAHLQQLVRDQIGVLDPNLLVLAEEVGEWQDSRRRIDILCQLFSIRITPTQKQDPCPV